MDTLPNDLLLEIFELLSLRDVRAKLTFPPNILRKVSMATYSPSVLHNVSMVNWKFHGIAQRFLYRAVDFSWSFSRNAALLRTIRARPDLALHVLFLVADDLNIIKFDDVDENGKAEFATAVQYMNLPNEEQWVTAIGEHSPEVFLAVILFHLPTLQSLRMALLDLPKGQYLRQLAQGAIDPSSSLYGCLSNLSYLWTGRPNLSQESDVYFESLIPFLQLNSVESLKVSAVIIGDLNEEGVLDAERNARTLHSWPMHVPNITQVSIHHGDIKPGFLRKFLLPFTSLKDLSISWANTEWTLYSEDFNLSKYTSDILTSKATLERLKIDLRDFEWTDHEDFHENEAIGDLKALDRLTLLEIHGLALTGDYEEEDSDSSDEDLQPDPPVQPGRKPPLAIVDALPSSLIELKVNGSSLNLFEMLLELAKNYARLPNLKVVDLSLIRLGELDAEALIVPFSEAGVELKSPRSRKRGRVF